MIIHWEGLQRCGRGFSSHLEVRKWAGRVLVFTHWPHFIKTNFNFFKQIISYKYIIILLIWTNLSYTFCNIRRCLLSSIKVIKGILQSLNFRREGKYWTCNMKNLLVFVFTFSMLLMHVSGKFLIVFLIANTSACDTKKMQQKVGLAVIFFFSFSIFCNGHLQISWCVNRSLPC